MGTQKDPPKVGPGSKKAGPGQKPAPKAGAKKPASPPGKPGAKPAAKGTSSSSSSSPSSRRAAVKTDGPQLDREKGKGRKLTQEELKKAALTGKKIVAYSPNEIAMFLEGHRTLGEIEGVTKDEQYRVAEVGYRFLTEGKLDAGTQVFLGLVALDPYDAYFLTCLGSCFQQAGRNEDAERMYSRALEINPYQVTARSHRGELMAMSGRLSEAIDDLNRAITDDPKGDDPAVKRAAVLLKAIRVQLSSAS